MKIVKITLTLIVALLLLIDSSFAQKKSKDEIKGDESFELGEFAEAIQNYKVAYSKEKNNSRKIDMVFRIGQCYMYKNEPKSAELWFKKAIMVKYPDPIVHLFYANELKKNGKFEDAIEQFKIYKKLVPNDKRADIGVQSCEMSAKWQANPTRYAVENMAFFNSKASDFSTVFSSKKFDQVIFSSNREGSKGNRVHKVTGQGFTDLWEAKKDRKGKWSVPTSLTGDLVNTDDDEGACSLNLKGNTLFFTRCRVEKARIVGCKIYEAVRKGLAWGDPLLVNISGANDSINIAHPSLSEDELTLYFVAELPGGYGGKDIWMIKRSKRTDAFGEPMNLGTEINTPGNEVFPYSRTNEELYFSSDYHIGMGGLDIFKASLQQNGKWKVENMKCPINSPQDDFGIVFQGNNEYGFFASSRPGGLGEDDIYRFALPPLAFSISGVCIDEKTEEPIASAKVVLKGSDGTTEEATSEVNGSFHFKLGPNTDYQISTSAEGYLNGKAGVSTKGIEKDKDFKTDIYMAPIAKPIELPNILYDLGKWDLRPESMTSLDKLVQTLNDNPNIVIELRSHTDFRSDNQFNIELSQKRAQSVVDYLISKGIVAERLVAKGYGETMPKIVDKKIAERYSFLQEGQKLDERFIKSLATVEEQEVANQINRRTEFQVLKTDYVPQPSITPNETINPE